MLKELRGSTRKWQTYVQRMLYLALLAWVLHPLWAGFAEPGAALSVSDYANAGRRLFRGFLPVQIGFVTLAAIAAGSDMITREVRAGTLGLLALTPLSLKGVLVSKWKAASVQGAFLILCGLPLTGVCFFLGSIGVWDVVWSSALTLALATLGALVGVRHSAGSATATAALAKALAFTAGIAILAVLCPPVGILLAVVLTVGQARGAMDDLRRRSLFRSGTGTVTNDLERMPAYRGDVERPERPRRLYDGGVWEDHPLIWKELATGGGTAPKSETRAFLFGLLGGAGVLCWIYDEGQSLGTFLGLGGLMIFLALGRGASLFVPEKEGRRWEMLLASPVPPASLASAKLVGGLLSPWSLTVLGLWLVACVAWGWRHGPIGILTLAVASLLMLALAYSISALFSLRARTIRAAFLGSAGVLTLLLVVLPWITGTTPAALHPLGLIDALLPRIDPRAVELPAPPGLLPLAPYILVYGGVTAALLAVILARFRRWCVA